MGEQDQDQTVERDEEQQPELEGGELEALRAERDDFESKYLRALADLQNFQRRSAINEREARVAGVRSVVEPLVGVLDHFDLALQVEAETSTAQQVIGGVRVIRDELGKTLELQGVSGIEPAVGDVFEPGRHEAVLQQAADGVDPGCVSIVMQAGYALGDRVLRPAKVAVAPAAEC